MRTPDLRSGGPAAALLAEVTRHATFSGGDELVESRHHGHLVVTGPDGAVRHAVGDPDRVTFVRSTSKPFQATACLELLGDDATELTDEEVALSWASHRAEPIHLETARQLLERSGTGPDELTCPPSRSEDDPALPEARIQHNCSGKHSLFALTGRTLGLRGEQLLDPDGPLQRSVLGAASDALGPATAVAIDGCGAPTVAVPLAALARAFAALAAGGRWQRVRDAGLAAPALVGGEGRLETALLGAGVLAKVGAEGVFAAGWRAPDGTPRGLAVKVEDGTERAGGVAAHAALVAAGVVPASVWSPAPVLGGGRPVGRVRAAAELTAGLDTTLTDGRAEARTDGRATGPG